MTDADLLLFVLGLAIIFDVYAYYRMNYDKNRARIMREKELQKQELLPSMNSSISFSQKAKQTGEVTVMRS